MAKLYLVGTPIGNLGDMSPRGLETLELADFIAAEDTRVSMKLLNHFGLHKQMVSYHAHSAWEMEKWIIQRIKNGENCAIITDAGMPCISDPGEELVRTCAEQGIEVVVAPGPSAAIAALAMSGLPTGRFAFEGFLSAQKNVRQAHLESIQHDFRTLIFYEAPHKLVATLQDILEIFGDRRISLAREMTKIHEEVVRTTVGQAVEYYRENKPRGEFVLVVEGAKRNEEQPSFEEAAAMVRTLQGQGLGVSQAAKEVARETGYKKSDLYRAVLQE